MPLKRSDKWVSGLRPTTEVGSNPKDELGALKVPMALVSPSASVLQAFCMDDGAQKYGPYNFRVSKVQAIIYLEALIRHATAIMDGEDYDPKTGKPHIGYVLATAQIYADAWLNGNLIDNRPVPGNAGQLITMLSREPGQPELTPEQTRRLFEVFIDVQKQVPSAETLSTSQPAPAEVQLRANNSLPPLRNDVQGNTRSRGVLSLDNSKRKARSSPRTAKGKKTGKRADR